MPARPVDEGARAAVGGDGPLGELARWVAACSSTTRPAVRAHVVVVGSGDVAIRALAHALGARVELLTSSYDHDPATGAPPPSVGAVAAAVDAGRDAAARAAASGATVLVGGGANRAGELGAACVAAWLTGEPPASDAAARALARSEPHIRGPLGALRRFGGGDLATLCGVALGAGECGLGYVCDGLVPTAAAALAAAIEPGLRPRLLAAHPPSDAAHALLLGWLGLAPVLDLPFTSGDGSGALAACAVLRLACDAR